MTTHKEALEAAYLAGFNASGEGYNGEYPFGDKMQDPAENRVWKKDRDNYIKEALAQPERHELQADGKHPAPCARFCEANAFQIEIRRLKAQLAQPEQEPVAVVDANDDGYWADILPDKDVKVGQHLYTTPPQRKPWVSLSDDEVNEIVVSFDYRYDVARATEAKLRELNEAPQRKPQFKEFIKWAGAQGYDCAQTCNSDTGEWIVLNPMTADLWKAWQAAHGIKGEA